LTHLRRGEIKEARKLLDPWLKRAPASENPWSTVSSTLSELGWTLYGALRYRDALVVFRDLEKLHRGQRELYADPFDGQGWCYLRTDKKKEARKAFEAALAITPGYASSQTGLDTLDEEK
jgi:Tfp pilus assembly protein PilF